jgi:hypothetical protein
MLFQDKATVSTGGECIIYPIIEAILKICMSKMIIRGQILIHLEYLYGCLTLHRTIIFTGSAPNAPLS